MQQRIIKKPIPRGLRNNNPLNIRIGNTWLGERPNPTDTQFEEFVSIDYGLRAAFLILRRYIRRYRRNTIQKIIESWAPASENATQIYIDFVATHAKIDAATEVDFADRDTMCNIVAAMAHYECGQPIDFDVIVKAYNLT